MIIAELISGGLHFVLDRDKKGRARLIHFSSCPFDSKNYKEDNYSDFQSLIELHTVGSNTKVSHGSKHLHTCPAYELQYEKHTLERTEDGQILKVYLVEEKTKVCMHYRFYNNASIVRSWAEIINISEEAWTIDYVSSFMLSGISAQHQCWDSETYLYMPHNTTFGEVQWAKNSLRQLGLSKLNVPAFKRLSWSQTGTWSSSEYLPMGVYENPKEQTSLYWQIENNGSWYCEMGVVSPDEGLYIQLCGPQYEHNHFMKIVNPGETFVTVSTACGVCGGGFDEAIGEMTKYRRNIRRKNEDNENLPIIYNDYMNCLFADPTTEKELPLIDAAAEAGAEYYVIDAGWFVENPKSSWWETIGAWKEATWRFPNGGLTKVMNYIRSKGMKPGLWIEIEGMGTDCELANTLPDDWFFQIRGQRMIENFRYQLDFRNPKVIRFASETLERMINQYGLKYLKIDYNVNAGLGTDFNAESLGSGLLAHCRAYLDWIDSIFDKYPDIVIENCASGGMRMDYALLSRLSIQSTSDQTRYDWYSSISSMAASAVTPEQAAIWTYPNFEADEEETCFNMINAMLGRVHLSGHLSKLPKSNFERVKEGLACYKLIRKDIKNALPRFPLGLIEITSPWAATVLDCNDYWYMSVWRIHGENAQQDIPLLVPEGKEVKVSLLYPEGLPVAYEYDENKKVLRITLENKLRARFFKIEFKAKTNKNYQNNQQNTKIK